MSYKGEKFTRSRKGISYLPILNKEFSIKKLALLIHMNLFLRENTHESFAHSLCGTLWLFLLDFFRRF